jgi:hypothetical protein
MRRLALLAALALVIAGCSGDSSDEEPSTESPSAVSQEDMSADDASGGSSGGAVVQQQAAGTALASVEGLEYTFTMPGGVACSISEEAVTFSYRIGDNEVTLGGGANLYDDGWLGSIDLRVANPSSEPGPITYYPDLGENGDGIAIDGDSMSYSGPMLKQPANDGSLPEPVDVGDGVISVSC